MVHDKARVEAIRAQVKTQIELIDSLKAKIVKGELESLDVARNQTEDIETFFLQDLERRARTPEDEARWLDWAEQTLRTWLPYLKRTQVQFEKFGDRGIEVVGG